MHGKFIPDDPSRLPLPVRTLIGIGVAIVIMILIMLCVDVLGSFGVWVTLLIVSVLTASSIVIWVWDSVWRGARASAAKTQDGP